MTLVPAGSSFGVGDTEEFESTALYLPVTMEAVLRAFPAAERENWLNTFGCGEEGGTVYPETEAVFTSEEGTFVLTENTLGHVSLHCENGACNPNVPAWTAALIAAVC